MTFLNSLFPADDPLSVVLEKISAVAEHNHKRVFLVGGVVRDRLLGVETKDIDISVIGSGIEFAHKLAKSLKVNNVIEYARFGTAMIPYGDKLIEVATARTEEYEDSSRKPQIAESDLRDDLARRDFTINAMALALNRDNYLELTDYFEGLKDLDAGIIRTPLDPITTFSEDPLRMLRAIRFATQLNFKIETNTFKSIEKVRERITIISQERITDELTKILKVPEKPSRGFELLKESTLLDLIMPEIAALDGVDQRNGHHHKDVFKHTLQVLDNVAQKTTFFDLRLTALLHDIAKPLTKQFFPDKGWTFYGHEELGAQLVIDIGKRLRLPNRVIEYASKLTRLHLRPIAIASEGVTDSAVRRLIVEAGEELDDLITLCRADITSKNVRKVETYSTNFDHVVQFIEEVREKDRMRAFQSPVRGDEIMRYCNLQPGAIVGWIKTAIEEAILRGEIDNTYDAAHTYLEQNHDELVKKFKESRKQ
ncbi:MAG: HD domain-containing protein [Candidatus Neomarinimicrobiota bacterium]